MLLWCKVILTHLKRAIFIDDDIQIRITRKIVLPSHKLYLLIFGFAYRVFMKVITRDIKYLNTHENFGCEKHRNNVQQTH